MTLIDRIARPGPKKLLALDGGGIRGVLALEVLQKLEDLLKAESGRAELCLADYFDYIAGTGTSPDARAGLEPSEMNLLFNAATLPSAPAAVQKLDSVEGIPDLRRVGRQVAERKVDAAHLAGFPAA